MKERNVDKIAMTIYEAPLGNYIGRDGAVIFAERVADERLLKAEELLYKKGDVADSFYILAQGRLALVSDKSNNGRESIVHVLDKGDMVGELSFVDQTPHELSVRALGDATVLCFSWENIKPLITEHPELMFNFMRAVIKRAHHVVTAMGEQERELEKYIATGGRGRG